MRQTVDARVEFIEFRLLWEGRVSRRDLIEQFRISPAQASADLKRYQESAGSGVAYDERTKAYMPTPAFRPQRLEYSADHYLAQLSLSKGSALASIAYWISEAPDFATMPRARPSISAGVLGAVLSSIRRRERLEVRYQSLTTDAQRWRWIAPHALVNDGFRWHARAWCYEREEFRDFVLSRMQDARVGNVSALDPSLDEEWTRFVTLCLAPHPGLQPHEKRAVQLDYNMSDGFVFLPSRACLFRYVEWQLRLDIDESLEPKSRTQVVLVNRDEVVAECRKARERGNQRGSSAIRSAT